jgi:hypothetical protein
MFSMAFVKSMTTGTAVVRGADGVFLRIRLSRPPSTIGVEGKRSSRYFTQNLAAGPATAITRSKRRPAKRAWR